MTDRSEFENPAIDDAGLSAALLQQILSIQTRMLERIVLNEHTSLLDELCRLAESVTSNAVASVMLFDRSRDGLFVESGPSLNQFALDALNGLKSGEGSCGNTVFHNEPMYVCNTQDDARWTRHRDVARQLNICSCFSFPVHNSHGECIGSFAISSFEPRRPDQFHQTLLSTCASIASVIIQRQRDDELRRQILQEQARTNQINSLGVLAGGIAHDFNNLMTTIMGSVDLARSYPDADCSSDLELALKAIRQARSLTDQLQTLSRGAAPDRSPFEVSAVVREAAEFALHGSKIALELTGLSEGGCCVLNADRAQVGQLVQNLVLNARQGMPDGGTVRVSCACVQASGHRFLDDGRYLQIVVRDTGGGIPEELLERVFDPYFSTREDGHGLGLFLCFSIAQRHGGRIDIDSTVGEGTTVSVHFPFDSAVTLPESTPKSSLPATGTGAILIVDDQNDIRRTLRSILQRLGYEVVEAASGEEAIARVQDRRSTMPFQCAIVDLTIPGGMGGRELNEHIRRLSPRTKVVLSTGYSRPPGPTQRFRHAFHATLAKPYSVSDVQQLLCQLSGDQP